jgi:hypothetical protein
MSKTARLEKSWLSNSRSAIKTNKLLLNSFYTLKVFKKISSSQAIARSGEAHSETFINLVKMSLPIAEAGSKNAGKFNIEAGGR